MYVLSKYTDCVLYISSFYSCNICVLSCFFLSIRRPPRSTRTDTLFPTRRSSDLHRCLVGEDVAKHVVGDDHVELLRCAHQLRSEEHTSELQSLMRISYAVFCLKKKNKERPDINTDKSIHNNRLRHITLKQQKTQITTHNNNTTHLTHRHTH